VDRSSRLDARRDVHCVARLLSVEGAVMAADLKRTVSIKVDANGKKIVK
jgi:hypothetical protein